jgi:hypothetical protein
MDVPDFIRSHAVALPHIAKFAGQRLADGHLLNAVLVLMLVTSILGPTLTERFAPALLQEAPQPESPLLAGRG